MAVIYGVIYILLVIIIFNLISLISVHIKAKQILSNKNKNIHKIPKYISEYLNKIESKLSNLNYPYKLNKKRYLVIKYIFSIVIFIVSVINYKSVGVPIVLLIIVFFIPDYLIHSYTKKEKHILIGELSKISSSLILSITSFASFSNSLEISSRNIKYKRFKESYDMFIKIYVMNGYDLKKAAKYLLNKFNSYELTLFLTTIIQGENDGELIESLERYREVLEINYFKYLKRKAAIKKLYVMLGTILSLINLVLIVMYPIIMQVINNLQLIFA